MGSFTVHIDGEAGPGVMTLDLIFHTSPAAGAVKKAGVIPEPVLVLLVTEALVGIDLRLRQPAGAELDPMDLPLSGELQHQGRMGQVQLHGHILSQRLVIIGIMDHQVLPLLRSADLHGKQSRCVGRAHHQRPDHRGNQRRAQDRFYSFPLHSFLLIAQEGCRRADRFPVQLRKGIQQTLSVHRYPSSSKTRFSFFRVRNSMDFSLLWLKPVLRLSSSREARK